jgi:plastocyanin
VASVQHAGATSILRFAPATIRIHVGDSVTFTNQDLNAPHTVTFGTELPDTSGVGPGFVSYGGTTVSSTGDQVNSGWLISQQLIDYVNAAGSLLPLGYTPVRQVTFTFTKADTYHYFCALHDFLGMVGTIIVSNDDSASG